MQDLFDPITLGHVDIIKRAVPLFSKIHILLGINSNKKSFFSDEEKLELIRSTLFKELDDSLLLKTEVASYNGLIVNYAKEVKATVLIRGIRSVSDFEYELTLAGVNKTIENNIETLFLPTSPDLAVVSSSMVKEIARYGGDIEKFVPKNVSKAINSKFGFIKYGDPEK